MSNEYFCGCWRRSAEQLGFSIDTPWERLPAKAQKAVLHGSPDQVHVRYRNRYGRERSYYAGFEGVMPFLERRHADTDSDYSGSKYEGYMREVPCPVCHGTRLKPESSRSRSRPVDRRGVRLSIGECAEFLARWS
jgi:excinuclease ABC subunit A